MNLRRMGCLQLKRWLSFLPAAFVVYILLHYFVYQPDIQETHSSFLGSSSSRRIVKLSDGDSIQIKEAVRHPNGEQTREVTLPSKVVGLPTNSSDTTLPSDYKEKDLKLERIDLSRNSINGLQYSVINGSHQSPQEDLFSDQYNNIAPTIPDVAVNDKYPIEDEGLSNEIISMPQDSNKDASLFASRSAMNDVMKSFQLKRALELKSMLVRRGESKVAMDFLNGSEHLKPILEETVDSRNIYSDVKNEPIVETVYDFFPAKSSGIDLSANYVPTSSELKTNANIVAHPVENLVDQPLNQELQIIGTGIGESNPNAGNYGTQDENNIIGNSVIAKEERQDLPSEQDSIIVPRELLSGEGKRELLSSEENNSKKNYENSNSLEEKEKRTVEEIRKGIPEGSGISVAANFNSSQLLDSLVVVSQNEKSQIHQNVKVGELNSTATKLVPELKSNNSNENQSVQVPSKQLTQVVPKSEAPPSPATKAASSPVQSKSTPAKPTPKVVAAIKLKNASRQKKDPPGFAITALNGPVSVGQRYEKGFATAHEDLCPNNGRDLKVLILITSAPDHEKHRNAVRQTWGHFSMRRDIAMAFVVGRTARTDVQIVIDKENDRYGDIIEANFVDHYSNLTLKTVAMFEWTKTYCSESRFVLKTDDDMYINVPLLLAFIMAKNGEKRAIFGRLAKGWKPVRNTKSKYYIDTATYSRVRYPDFLTGPAYLFTNDIVEEMYLKVLNTTFFVLEDVLITGIVGESLGVKRVGDSHFRNEKIKLADTCKLMQSISIHMVKYEEQFDIYKRTLDGKTKCKTR